MDKNLEKLLEAGKVGAEYAKDLGTALMLKAKNTKEELAKNDSFTKIGKAIYQKKINVNNDTVKAELAKIKKCDANIKANNAKVAELEAKNKKNPAYKNAEKLYNKLMAEVEKGKKSVEATVKKATKKIKK